MSTYPTLYQSLSSSTSPSEIAKLHERLPSVTSPKTIKAIVAIVLVHHLTTTQSPVELEDLPYGMGYEEGVLTFDSKALPRVVLSKIAELLRVSAP